MVDAIDTRSDTRQRIVDAAAALLHEEGQSGVTTRGVADRAGVQPPTIYRIFGDKDGLLEAVAEQVMTAFTSAKAEAVAGAHAADVDPVEDLRTGWDTTIDFGIANPDLFVLISDPTRSQRSAAVRAGTQVLADRIHRLALGGRLRVSEDRAVELVHAAGTGAILATLERPLAERDRRLADELFDAIARQIISPAGKAAHEDPSGSLVSHAVSLRAHAAEAPALTSGERALFAEWLDRIIDAEPQPGLPHR